MTRVICARFECLFNNDCGDCRADRIYIKNKKFLIWDWLGTQHECDTFIHRDSERAKKAERKAMEIIQGSTGSAK